MEDGGFELRSGAEGAPSDEASATHCVGRYGAAVADGWSHVDEEAVRQRCVVPADTADFYASFAAGGLEYGPAYRRVASLWVSPSGAEATSRLLPRGNLQRTQVHPADLDGALQSTKVLASGDGGSDQTRLPFSIDTALMRGKASGQLWAAVASRGSHTARVQLVGSGGRCHADLEGYRSRELQAHASAAPPLPTFVCKWARLEPTVTPPAARTPTLTLTLTLAQPYP